MTQSQLNRAVARITGEPLHQIRAMGFSFVPAPVPPRLRRSAQPRRRSAAAVVECASAGRLSRLAYPPRPRL
jgi:hypothetical protein